MSKLRLFLCRALTILYGANLILQPVAYAQSTAPAAPPVVINEVAWAGTTASGDDEWIELFNTTNQPVDLSGWSINDSNGSQVYRIQSGTVAARGYFLIEDGQEATSVPADAVINLSLSNAGDSLVLLNALGQPVDTVNSTGGAWYTGSTRATMERISTATAVDNASNWASATNGSGATDRASNPIQGTPKNANSAAAQTTPLSNTNPIRVRLTPGAANPAVGDNVTVTASVENVSNLFSYGLDISYDTGVLTFSGATNGGFLSTDGSVGTTFQAGLENRTAGRVVVAESRLNPNQTGVSGRGNLVNLAFRVTGRAGTSTQIRVLPQSFIASASSDAPAQFTDASLTIQAAATQPPQNAQAAAGSQRYSIALTWQATSGSSDQYRVMRRAGNRNFVQIGMTQQTTFTDTTGIIPNLTYEYSIVAIRNGIESATVSVSSQERRGIKGDNNRSDRVDGRDLQRIAQHFTEVSTDRTFDPLIDTTYDGRIDGADLIDIGVNWAVTYSGT